MAIVVQVLAGLLAIAGAAGFVYGVDLLPTERGMTATIASVTAISGAFVVFALGLTIQRLDQMTRQLESALRSVSLPRAGTVAPESGSVVADAMAEDLLRDLPQPEPVVAKPELPVAPAVRPVLPVDGRPVVPFDRPSPREPAPEPDIPSPPVSMPLPVPEPASNPPRRRFSLPGFGRSRAAATSAAVATAAAGAALAINGEPAGKSADPPLMPTPPEPAHADSAVDAAAKELDETQALAVDAPEPVDVDGGRGAMPDPMADLEAELDRLIPLRPDRTPPPETKPLAVEASDLAVVERPAAPDSIEDKATDTVVAEPAAVEVDGAVTEKPDLNPDDARTTTEDPPPATLIADHDDLPVEAQPVTPPESEIVGSYESGGARYTMYASGAVMVQSGDQTVQFESLEALRQFIEDGGKV